MEIKHASQCGFKLAARSFFFSAPFVVVARLVERSFACLRRLRIIFKHRSDIGFPTEFSTEKQSKFLNAKKEKKANGISFPQFNQIFKKKEKEFVDKVEDRWMFASTRLLGVSNKSLLTRKKKLLANFFPLKVTQTSFFKLFN